MLDLKISDIQNKSFLRFYYWYCEFNKYAFKINVKKNSFVSFGVMISGGNKIFLKKTKKYILPSTKLSPCQF